MGNETHRTVHLHLPRTQPIDIKFEAITYSVSVQGSKDQKLVLKGVSGKFRSGELTAIMGPSGAGKSSLLNILTGFQNRGMGGHISSTYNTLTHKGSAQYRKQSSYILQDDQLTPLFTVGETMRLAADLKLGDSLSEKAKNLVMDDILDTLGLSEHRETRCERLSGGQKKRLSIALELIDNPPVMFLDEPTTGLDSLSSSQCVSMLKSLASGGRTIICTIHQPSASLYELFDHVYVLAAGQCIYQGAAKNTVAYLAEGADLHCPKYHNPADYLMEVATGDHGDYIERLATVTIENGTKWCKPEDVEESDSRRPSIQTTTNGWKDPTAEQSQVARSMVLVRPPSEWKRFRILLRRSVTQVSRDWTVTHVRLALHLCVGLLLGLNFFNSGNDGSQTISNVGYMLCSTVYLCYTAMMPAVLRFPSEVPILRKESFNNWYRLRTYYFAYLVTHIPLQIFGCSIYAAVSYLLSSQPLDPSRFLMFVLACVMLSLTAEGMGVCLGTVADPINGTFIGAILTAIMLALGGFLVFFAHMPRAVQYISQLSFLRHALQALVLSVYGRDRPMLQCPEDAVFCPYKSPQHLLQEIGWEGHDYWFNFAMLSGYLLLFRVVGFCSLKRRLGAG